MKQMAQRTMLLILLGGFAVVWTFLMGLGVAPTSASTGTEPGFSPTDAVVGGTGAQITYVDESRFPAVTVYLVANDQNSQPVLGLQQANFALTEDDAPVPITDFTTAGNQAATVMLVIDRSGSMNDEAKFVGAQQAAVSFIEHLQPGQDQAGVIVFSARSEVIAPLALLTDASKQALIDQIQGLSTAGGTQFYQAVQDAIDQFRAASGRKVVLALTDGRDDNGQTLLAATIEAASDANVAVYTIGLGSDVDEDGLRQLADANGGAYYFSPDADQLEQLYLDIAGSLRNEYALTYQSATPNLDGTRRNLQVTLTTAGGQQIQAGGVYGVAGVLATSLNPALFFPLFIVLFVGLVALYQLPQWRRRPSPALDEPLAPVSGAPSFAPAPSPARTASPAPATSVTPTPLAGAAPTLLTPVADPARGLAETVGAPKTVITPTPVAAPSTLPRPATAGASVLATGGPALVQQLPLASPETIIGSASGCQVVVAHPSVQPQHARITPDGSRYVLDDLSAGQTQVSFNGDPAQLRAVQRNALRDGSLLRVGEVRLIFRQPAAQPPLLERRFPLSIAGLTLGSDPACDIIIGGVAPRQARLIQEEQRWVVEDLAGGGTAISYSGNPAQERAVAGRNALKTGSTLRIGAMTLRLEA